MILTHPTVENVKLVSISGGIGVGKSTLVKGLCESNALQKALEKTHKHVQVVFVEEPVHKWKQWLARFYADPEHLALPFQLLVFDFHVDAVLEALQTFKTGDALQVCVVERSMYDQLLFWTLQCELGRGDSMENEAYMRVWRKWNFFLPPVDHIFHCKTSTLRKSMERIQSRGRLEEKEAQEMEEYQRKLIALHNEWFTEGCTTIPLDDGEVHQIPCTHIDMDAAFHEDPEELEDIAKCIANAIK